MAELWKADRVYADKGLLVHLGGSHHTTQSALVLTTEVHHCSQCSLLLTELKRHTGGVIVPTLDSAMQQLHIRAPLTLVSCVCIAFPPLMPPTTHYGTQALANICTNHRNLYQMLRHL